MSARNTLETHRTPVQGAYSFQSLKRDVLYMRRSKSPKSPKRRMSYREIAAKFGSVSHAVIQRICKGIEPKTPAIRAALGLTTMLPAPACPKCNEVHVTSRCPHELRRSITVVDPYLASLKRAHQSLSAAMRHANQDDTRRESAYQINLQLEVLIKNIET